MYALLEEYCNEVEPKGFVPFSKIEFHESFWTFRKGMPVWGDEKIIFLDIPKRELSVQVIRTGQDLSNKIYSIKGCQFKGDIFRRYRIA